MKLFILSTLIFITYQPGFSQTDSIPVQPESVPVKTERQQVYKVNNWVDIPLTVATTAYTLYGFTIVYGREKTPEAVILALDPNDVNSLDRPVIKNRSQWAKSASDKLFYGSMPAPLIFLLDKRMRKDAAKIGLLYVQATSIFGSVYVTSSMIAKRFRPYTYNPEVEIGKRRGGGGKNSFPAGHPGFVATSTFFMAKVYADYHPEMKNKWILYTVAGAASVATGILRINAGEHFITDVMVGIPVGVATGLLVPHIHKIRGGKTSKLTFVPNYKDGASGFYASWKL